MSGAAHAWRACHQSVVCGSCRTKSAAAARAVSSVGRASRLHREGRRFEPVTAHQASGASRALSVMAWAFMLGGAALAPAAAQERGGAMSFRVAPWESGECGNHCPDVIVADGVIEEETPGGVPRFSQDPASRTRSCAHRVFQFPGGNVVASMDASATFCGGSHRRRRRTVRQAGAIRARSSANASRPACMRSWAPCAGSLPGQRNRASSDVDHRERRGRFFATAAVTQFR